MFGCYATRKRRKDVTMPNDSGWVQKTYTNDITGDERQTWRKTIRTGAGHRMHLEVYELAERYYWSANVLIVNRPDLSGISSGTTPANRYALVVAKTRACRIARDALRASKTPRGHTIAA